MEIRRVNTTVREEALAARQVGAIAFRDSKWYLRLLEELREIEKSGGQLSDSTREDPARTIWGAYLDDKLIAVTQAIDYQMRYEGQTVSMCGIGGVATLPEYRRQGSVRAIMRDVLRDCRDKGQIFSYLFPFSYEFYGRFGYGYGCRYMQVEIPMAALKTLPDAGSVKRCGPADLPAIEEIYNRFVENTNSAVVRSPGLWKSMFEYDPYADQVYTYLWSDSQGNPAAWMTCETKKTDRGDHFIMTDWACLSLKALSGLLAFIKRFDSQYALTTLKVPLHIHLSRLFPEPHPISQRLEYSGQIRVVDIRRALELLRRPCCPAVMDSSSAAVHADHRKQADDELYLMVEDDFLPENSGRYTLDYSGPVNQVSFIPASSLIPGDELIRDDLQVSARLLATLLLGCNSLADLCELPEVRINPSLPAGRLMWLHGFFPGKVNAIYDYF